MTTEIKPLIEALQKQFHDFKAEHTAQLDAVKKGNTEAFQALKVEQINAEIDRLQKAVDDTNIKMAAAELGGAASGRSVKDREYTSAFNAHMKRGDIQAALNKGTAADGGFTAPAEWDRTITDKLVQISPMRQLATVQTISGNAFSKLFNQKGTVSGWVGETAARPETNTPQFGSLTYTTGEIYANPSATQQMLDDSEVNLEAWLAGEVEQEFAFQEGVAFLSGSGVNRPNGILTYVAGGTNAAAHPYGAIAVVNSGAAAALTADGIVNLTETLPSEFTANARFVMNKATIRAIRLLKDGQGNYLWQPTFAAGGQPTINGYGFTEMAGMPNIAAGTRPILFGDFARGYLVIDRVGVRVLRDPFTAKPYVMFYTTKRVGGGLLNPEVLRALNVSI